MLSRSARDEGIVKVRVERALVEAGEVGLREGFRGRREEAPVLKEEG